jgi:hypothetical protein
MDKKFLGNGTPAAHDIIGKHKINKSMVALDSMKYGINLSKSET